MPVYQYACTACDEQLEVRQSFTDASLTVCPACEGRLRKVLTAVGVVFKGSGFYRNDSRAAPANGATSDGAQGESSKDPAAKDSGTPAAASASESSGSSGSSDGAKKSSGETRSSNGSPKKSGSEKKPVAS